MKRNRLVYLLLVVFLVATIGLTLSACKKPTPQPQTGDEAGAYYYDAGSDEYTVVLGEGLQFSLNIAGTTMAGKYLLEDGALVLTSNKQDDDQISAALSNDVIILTFGGAEYRFLKKVNYTVTFNSNGGSAVNSATVINGKKVSQPADPTKDGFVFVGWYSDVAFSAPFSFNSIITANTTVYARWVEKQVGALEFTVSFDADNGQANPESKLTVSGGKLFNLPVVEKDGYTFKGWWVSMNGDDTLSYEYTEGMTLDADTTLHAVWQANNLGSKLADPLVNVDANSIKWSNVGAREYLLQVKDVEGNFIVDKTVGGTAENLNFANYPAGDYIVTVTAVAASGEQNNSVCTRIYKNKAIARVSQFKVIEPATLLFNAVENAEKYLIKVTCGDVNHNHNKEEVYLDNGSFTHFSFADCMMGNNGIKFTVLATADGFATSTSAEFTYAPKLDAVTDFKFDEQTQTLVWTPVANATGYMLSVKCGNGALSEQFVNVGSANSVCLKECSNVDGGIIVKVYPVSQMFISPEAASYTFNKQNLATPQDIRIQGTTVSWSEVEGATSYEVRIAGATISAETNSVDLAGKVTLNEKESYSLVVVANGANASLPTDPVDARILAMADVIKYQNGQLSWAHVVGAQKYEVQVNDDEAFTVSDGVNFTNVDLTKSGENTLKVRFVDENGIAFEWVSTKVFAHTVTFVSDGGSSVSEQFKAVGDSIQLPKPQKDGYDFLNWYRTPKGPETNGAAFKDTVFNTSGDLVLYACYTSKAYTVTYHYGNGGNGVATSDTALYQQNFQWAVPQANDATSAFGGWFSAPNGNGVQYTDDKGVSLNPWSKLENADVYAFWYDDVLSFNLTNNGGRQIYAVMQGSRIDLVSEVTIPATYKGIKVGMLSGNAFKGCSNLTTINIPNTIEIISDVDPFTGCSSLTAINVYEVEGNSSIRYWSADGVLFDNGRLDQQPSDPSQIKSALSYMPLGKTGSYTIPSGIVEIPSLAFGNSALTRIVIPASVATIGMEAFKDCKNLTTVVFDSGSKTPLTIGDGAFSGCKSLETITLPARLVSIELTKYTLENATGTPAAQRVNLDAGVTNAFVGCTNLKNIYIAKGNTSYKSQDGIIYNANGTQLLYALPSVCGDVVIPDGVTTIANGAFIDCDYIESVTIPNTIVTIGECAFYNTDIESLTFKGLTVGNTDVTIGKYAFRGCDDLETVTFEAGNRVAVIGEGAFYGCEYLESIELPANLKSIGVQAFRDCESLEEVLFHKDNDYEVVFGSDAFYNCESLEMIELPKNVKELPGVFGGCTSLEEVIVHEDNQYFTSEEGILYDKAKTTILFYPQNKYDEEYVTPETLTTIADGVFKGNGNLESITIGKNVTKIGAEAFSGCGYLEELIFEDGGTQPLEIGAYAFYDMRYLRSIELPNRTKKVGEYAFACSSSWYASLRSITFNEGLEEISDGMLSYQTYITELNIPSSVKRIGNEAFYYCSTDYSNYLLNVTFAEDSQLETIGEDAFYYCAGYADEEDELSIVLPQGLKHIAKHAFYSSGFVSVTIPNTVTTIGVEAFEYCGNLSTVTFEEGGTEDLLFVEEWSSYKNAYYNGAFYNLSELTTVALPSRLTFLGGSAFEYCNSLETVTFGENSRLQYIGASAFASTGIETITIPNTVANGTYVIDANGTQEFRIGIGDQAFYSTSKLATINFAPGGTDPLSLGTQALYTYQSLTTINLPARLADYTDADGNIVAGISAYTFVYLYSNGGSDGQASSSKLQAINVEEGGTYYCSQEGVLYTADKKTLILYPVAKTGKAVIPAEVTLIGDYSFAQTGISEVEFVGGNDDMVIGERAFYHCDSLTEVVLSDNVVELKNEAFGRCEGLTSLTLSAKMSTFNPEAFSNTNATISVSPNSPEFSAENGIVFNKNKTVLISYPTTAEAESYTVPATVTEIAANAFENNKNIQSVALPAGLVTIGAYAFSGCSLLTNLTIPNTVETIGENAFNQCSTLGEVTFAKGGTASLVIETYAFQNAGITAVELPARLTTIGRHAFYGCMVLSSLTFEANSRLDSIGDSAFDTCTSLQNIALPQGLSVIGNRVFASCSALVSATFGEGLTTIGNYTFTKCASLVSVAFPASLKTMGISTFADGASYSNVYCTSLKSVSFAPGSQLEVIPESTFYNCSSLERFTVPAGVKAIESVLWDDGYSNPESGHFGAFQGCTSLKTVTFEEGSKCVEIGKKAFAGCSSLEAFAIPSSVSTLGRNAFEGCSSLVEIVIPSTTTVYGPYLFYKCSSLERVTLNDKATALPDGMFHSCSSLKQIAIPASVTSFGTSLFEGAGLETFVAPANLTVIPNYFMNNCRSLTSLTLHEGITDIGTSAFANCESLKNIVVPNKVTVLGNNVFSGCSSLQTVKLPSSLQEMSSSAFYYCTSLQSYAMDNDGNDKFKISDGVLYNADTTKILGFPAQKTSLIIPATITVIDSYAFQGAVALENVTILGQVTEIGQYAFEGCTNLKNITLPDSVTVIYDYAFRNCTSLTSITLPANLVYLGSYRYYSQVFAGCTSLSSIAIPNGVSTLYNNTFLNCTSLESVTLPTSLTSFNAAAFTGCTALSSLSMDNGGNSSFQLVDGVLYSTGSSGSTLQYIPAAKTGSLELSANLTDVYSLNVLTGATGITEFSMTNNGNDKFKIYDGALYKYTQNSDGDITSLVLFGVPAGKSGVLTLPKGITGVPTPAYGNNYYSLNSITMLTNYVMEGCEDISFKVVTEDGTSKLIEVASDATETEVKSGTYRVIDGALYQINVVTKTYYYINSYDTYSVPMLSYKLISVPAGKTGTFTVSKYVFGGNVDNYAFANCKLDLLKFEERDHSVITDDQGEELYKYSNSDREDYKARTPGLEMSYSSSWLNVVSSIKVVELSILDFDSFYASGFDKWTAEQTIRFKETEAVVKSKYSSTISTSANIEYAPAE